MLAASTLPDLTEQDYLAGEKLASVRHEYVDVKVYAMACTSLRHNDIAMNISFALRAAARGTPCKVNVSDVKVRVEHSKAYYYPDVMVGCERSEADAYYLDKPCLIVEITSKSTEWIDRHQKTLAYQTINSLQAYLIVAQDKQQVTLYVRDSTKTWEVGLYDQAEQTLFLPCLDTKLSLSSIYEGIDFNQTTTEIDIPIKP